MYASHIFSRAVAYSVPFVAACAGVWGGATVALSAFLSACLFAACALWGARSAQRQGAAIAAGAVAESLAPMRMGLATLCAMGSLALFGAVPTLFGASVYSVAILVVLMVAVAHGNPVRRAEQVA